MSNKAYVGNFEDDTKAPVEDAILYYMSTEALHNLSKITPEQDVYSIGVLFYKMLFNSFPFAAKTDAEFQTLRKQTSLHIPSQCSMFTSYILEGCLQFNSANRIAFDKLLQIFRVDLRTSKGPLFIFPFDSPDVSTTINLMDFKRKDLINKCNIRSLIECSMKGHAVPNDIALAYKPILPVENISSSIDEHAKVNSDLHKPNVPIKNPKYKQQRKKTANPLAFAGNFQTEKPKTPDNQYKELQVPAKAGQKPNTPNLHVIYNIKSDYNKGIILHQNDIAVPAVPIPNQLKPEVKQSLIVPINSIIISKNEKELISKAQFYQYFDIKEKYGPYPNLIYNLILKSGAKHCQSIGK
jgi:hypothetical protein